MTTSVFPAHAVLAAARAAMLDLAEFKEAAGFNPINPLKTNFKKLRVNAEDLERAATLYSIGLSSMAAMGTDAMMSISTDDWKVIDRYFEIGLHCYQGKR